MCVCVCVCVCVCIVVVVVVVVVFSFICFMPPQRSGGEHIVLLSVICPCVRPSNFIVLFVSLQFLLQFSR